MSRAYLLTWNPKKWNWPRDDYEEQMSETRKGKMYPLRWSCGNTRGIDPGDRLYLLRLHDKRGLIGSGWATGPSEIGPHWDETPGKTTRYVRGQSDVLLPASQRLTIEALKKHELGVAWDHQLKSGNLVPQESMTQLESIWREHVSRFQMLPEAKHTLPDEPSGKFIEGNSKLIRVNAYERDPLARQACLNYHGFVCAVCDRTLADMYGEIGAASHFI